MITAAIALLATAPAHAGHASMGVHGMVLFGGTDGLFASHLPLFRPPHDRQILLELRAEDAALDRELRSAFATAPDLWTIEPERFELDRLQPGAPLPLRSFQANVIKGHFERDGVRMHKGVRFHVVRVLANRALAPLPSKGTATYFPVGRSQTWFLVKKIESRPDFDHIVALAPGAQPRTIHIARQEEKQPPASAIEAALAGNAKVRTTVYFETTDLR